MSAATCVVGVDIGGTNMQFGVVDGSDRITGRARAKTDAGKGLEQVVQNTANGVKAACRDASVSLDDVSAVGIAAAGAMDLARGVVGRGDKR